MIKSGIFQLFKKFWISLENEMIWDDVCPDSLADSVYLGTKIAKFVKFSSGVVRIHTELCQTNRTPGKTCPSYACGGAAPTTTAGNHTKNLWRRQDRNFLLHEMWTEKEWCLLCHHSPTAKHSLSVGPAQVMYPASTGFVFGVVSGLVPSPS